MALLGFAVFLIIAVIGFIAGMEVYSHAITQDWPAVVRFVAVSLVSGGIIFAGVLVNGAIGSYARKRSASREH